MAAASVCRCSSSCFFSLYYILDTTVGLLTSSLLKLLVWIRSVGFAVFLWCHHLFAAPEFFVKTKYLSFPSPLWTLNGATVVVATCFSFVVFDKCTHSHHYSHNTKVMILTFKLFQSFSNWSQGCFLLGICAKLMKDKLQSIYFVVWQ